MANMRPASSLVIEPGDTLTAAPGGLHLMLVDLKSPLVEGTTVPLVLTFKDAGEITVQLKIEPQDESASTITEASRNNADETTTIVLGSAGRVRDLARADDGEDDAPTRKLGTVTVTATRPTRCRRRFPPPSKASPATRSPRPSTPPTAKMR